MNYQERIKKICDTEEKLIAQFPWLEKGYVSGIYFILRTDENGFKYAYIGQAKCVLKRLAEHMLDFKQHIDKSLKAHGLFSCDNMFGWKMNFLECDEEKLDEEEKYWIKRYADAGYQLRNKTAGGQGSGKAGINENKPSKGYYDGLEQGYQNAQKEVAKLFKYLTFDIDGKPNKTKEKMYKKFKDFLNIG